VLKLQTEPPSQEEVGFITIPVIWTEKPGDVSCGPKIPFKLPKICSGSDNINSVEKGSERSFDIYLVDARHD